MQLDMAIWYTTRKVSVWVSIFGTRIRKYTVNLVSDMGFYFVDKKVHDIKIFIFSCKKFIFTYI